MHRKTFLQALGGTATTLTLPIPTLALTQTLVTRQMPLTSKLLRVHNLRNDQKARYQKIAGKEILYYPLLPKRYQNPDAAVFLPILPDTPSDIDKLVVQNIITSAQNDRTTITEWLAGYPTDTQQKGSLLVSLPNDSKFDYYILKSVWDSDKFNLWTTPLLPPNTAYLLYPPNYTGVIPVRNNHMGIGIWHKTVYRIAFHFR